MKKIYSLILLVLISAIAFAQISITATGTAFTENFNGLANSGTTNAITTLPTGWTFLETGSNANTTYAADNGAANGGNTYSYGTTSSTERALGGLQSGSLNPTIGVSYINNSGATITSVSITYTGEQWRLGATGRADRLEFLYSTNATTLSIGTYTLDATLHFTAPISTGTAGALDGNASANKTTITSTITGLSIPVGGTIWFKWNDINVTSSDDGLGVDDFSATFSGTVLAPCTEPTVQPTVLTFGTVTTTSIAGSFIATTADKYIVVRSLSNTLSATPTDGTPYTVGTALGGGTVIANGSSLSFTDNALSPNTQYYYFVFAYNDASCSGGPNYLSTTPLENNATTLPIPACTTPTGPSNPITLTPANTSISGSFTGTGASKYLVIISTVTPPLGAAPTDGTVYTPGQAIGNGTVVTYTTTTTFVASGLTVATPYYIYVFAANDGCTGTPPVYSATFADGTSTTTNNSGIPNGYYTNAAGLTCAPLKTAISTIITTGHTQNNYGNLDNVEMLVTDVRLNDAGTATIMWDMYSDNPTGTDPYTYTAAQFATGGPGEGDGWNKEHSFPNSWFSASSSTNNVPGADLYHIYPTDMDVNSLRSNYPYGMVATATTTTANGSKLGSSALTFTGYTGPVFEPINAYKGDLARATLYMVTRYQTDQATWQNLKPEGSVVMDGTTYPSVEIDYLKMLLQWHAQDPVSAKETARNNAVYTIQGNRNPFVDHPEYVGQIWSVACGLALPIDLINFVGKETNNIVVLNWSVANAIGFSNFVVERSIDGVNFGKIANVNGVTNVWNYSFTDKNLPKSKLVYYRLKMIDTDGKYKYSSIVSVKVSNIFSNAIAYPNPTFGSLNIKLSNALATSGNLQITDVTGRVVKQQTVNSNMVNINVDVKTLPAGRYIVKITNNNEVINLSFVAL